MVSERRSAFLAEYGMVSSRDDFHPVILVADTAPDPKERMTDWSLAEARRVAADERVELRYFSPTDSFVLPAAR